jgi:hypothetical protein
MGRERLKEGVAQKVPNGEFRDVRQDFVVETLVIHADHQFGKQSSWISTGANLRDIITTKKRVGNLFCFEAKVEERFDVDPVWVDWRGSVDDGIVPRNHDGL